MAKPVGKKQQSGILSGHFKQGRSYVPELLAYPTTKMNDWVRDDLPDLLWPLCLTAEDGDDGIKKFISFQRAAARRLRELERPIQGTILDGRLTSLEEVPVDDRSTLRGLLHEAVDEASAMPTMLANALALYDDYPGMWLLSEFSKPSIAEPATELLEFLGRCIERVIDDAHLETLVKFVHISWDTISERGQPAGDFAELVRDYPDSAEQLPGTEAVIRAAFLSDKATKELTQSEVDPPPGNWAAQFWRRNWELSRCKVEEPVTPGETGNEPNSDEVDAHALETIGSVHDSYECFIRSAFQRSSVDLYEPAKHEVICGLVARAARATLATVKAPHLWPGEHSLSVLRILSEIKIYLIWMEQNGPTSYIRFQQYGIGKSKLMRKHMQELARTFTDDPVPEGLAQALDHLDTKLGGAIGEEFIPVNLDSTFSGKSVRVMATESDLDDEYRYAYQNASSVTHSEWGPVEDYALQRCHNPLHRYHRLPTLAPMPISKMSADALASKFDELASIAARLLISGDEATETHSDDDQVPSN